MPKLGKTAVVVPVLAADGMLEAVARHYPQAVRQGVPAHVSLLYPFLDLPLVDEGVLRQLRSCAKDSASLSVTFAEFHREPGFVGLEAKPLASLAGVVRGRWPNLAPYEGRFGNNPPLHLTIAMGVLPEAADDVVEKLSGFLPLTVVVDQLWLVAFDGVWHVVQTFPLGDKR